VRYVPLAVLDVGQDGIPTICIDPYGDCVEPEGALCVVPVERLRVPARVIVARSGGQYNSYEHACEILRGFVGKQPAYVQYYLYKKDAHGWVNVALSALLLVMLLIAMVIEPVRFNFLYDLLSNLGF